MIEPTIGRVVWVHRPGSISERYQQPEVGFIVFVHNPRLINIAGFDANGEHFAATSVQLLQDDDARLGGIYAWWMPYQKGQAAKTEALEKQIGHGG